MKRTLSKEEEFDILKLVMDKILLLAVAVIGFGLYQMVYTDVWYGVTIIASGAILSLLVMYMLVREYEYGE